MNGEFEVLVVDDDPSIRKRCVQLLHRRGYSTEGVSSGDAALSRVKNRETALVIADIRMPGLSGIELLEKVKKISPGTEVIMMTGYGTVESAVAAIKLGAYDYLTKPFEMDKLVKVVEHVATKFRLHEEVQVLRQRLMDYSDSSDIVTVSDKMQQIFDLVEKVAPTDCNVLISGESGTGKGIIARQIHRMSPRKSSPFVVVDCASLTETLFESELFGYVKGAFTGAYAAKDGYFRVADKGTIFLDEIGELSMGLQGRLLRIAQDHEIIPVGSTKPIRIDARIIAATNKDIEALVRAGSFREDLFFRLNVIRIDAPPLRERPEDVMPLTFFFFEKFKQRFQKMGLTLDRKVLAAFEQYEWPGNVRELENLVQYLVAVSGGSVIGSDLLPAKIRKGISTRDEEDKDRYSEMDFAGARKACLDSFTKKYVLAALQRHKGNVSATAREINIRRSSLQRMIKRFGLTKTT